MRDEDDMLFLVDANGANGVSAVSFEYFIANEWHTFQEKLVFRKLELQKDDEFYTKFLDF